MQLIQPFSPTHVPMELDSGSVESSFTYMFIYTHTLCDFIRWTYWMDVYKSLVTFHSVKIYRNEKSEIQLLASKKSPRSKMLERISQNRLVWSQKQSSPHQKAHSLSQMLVLMRTNEKILSARFHFLL
ncbi:hypothetical protein ACOSP7_032569 [Xanthoceras sorbifolium]